MNDAPIGIFDSGVGGLTVARAVLDLAMDNLAARGVRRMTLEVAADNAPARAEERR